MAFGAGASLVALGCGSKQRKPARADARYFVHVLMSGGHDTLYTTDPKAQHEVDGIVTLPTQNQIATAGDVKFGPHFAPLARWSSDLAVLNGIQVRTVNHETGQRQFFQLKTNVAETMPSALDIIATPRDGQPLGVRYLNASSGIAYSPAYFGTADAFYYGQGTVFDQLASSKPDELKAVAATLRQRSAALAKKSGGWREAEQTSTYLREVGDFFESVAGVPAFVRAERSTDYVAQAMAESFDRALWLIENDLCCGVVLDVGLLGWDTHIRNESKQAEMNGYFAQFFDDYLAGLNNRKNRHGLLADRTVTIVGSGLGPLPHQNTMLGRDHLPQTAFMMAGPGLRKGRSFGRTGRRLEGLPIGYADGASVEAGRVPVLDDIGATLLHLAGLDPERYGNSGQVCRFLLDRTS